MTTPGARINPAIASGALGGLSAVGLGAQRDQNGRPRSGMIGRPRSGPGSALTYLRLFRRVVVALALVGAAVAWVWELPWLAAAGLAIATLNSEQ
ncbi:MAG: hypothetical protein M3O34_09715 [Chloroflexota bacterium]|nr:hypothetical protein [Chloroflexota bacterium]